MRKLSAFLGAAAIAAAAYLGWRSDRARPLDPHAPERTFFERLESGTLADAELDEHVRLLVARLDRDGPEAKVAAERLAALRSNNIPAERQNSIAAALAAAAARSESAAATRVMEALRAGRTDGAALAKDYLKNFKGGASRAAVERGLAEYAQLRQASARAELRSLVADSPATLRAKIRALREFLADHRQSLAPDEANAIEVAAKTGERFAAAERYEFRLVRAGGFQNARRIKVRVACGGQAQEFGAAPADTAEWESARFEVRWKFGDPVSVQLLAQSRSPIDFSYHLAAEMAGSEPLGLKTFAQRTPIAAASEWAAAFSDAGPVVAFADSPLDTATWQAVEDYLSPGGKW
ncbi:MAG TPA: hypothetical protein VNC50_08905 [Planctomycetia bacterium]|nr:hypothetical protein [Planctomycetia bacterium]